VLITTGQQTMVDGNGSAVRRKSEEADTDPLLSIAEYGHGLAIARPLGSCRTSAASADLTGI
jgi:hypothetical protein